MVWRYSKVSLSFLHQKVMGHLKVMVSAASKWDSIGVVSLNLLWSLTDTKRFSFQTWKKISRSGLKSDSNQWLLKGFIYRTLWIPSFWLVPLEGTISYKQPFPTWTNNLSISSMAHWWISRVPSCCTDYYFPRKFSMFLLMPCSKGVSLLLFGLLDPLKSI